MIRGSGGSLCVRFIFLVVYVNQLIVNHAYRRKSGARASHLAKYIEIDFAENTTRKAMAIHKSRELSALLGKPDDVNLGMFSV